MKIGLIGMQKVGKTTIFNALTGSEVETNAYATNEDETNISIIEVLDPRITHLSEMYMPKKTIYATIEFMDFAGIASDSDATASFSNTINAIRNLDALALVLRSFSDPMLDSSFGTPNPLHDIETIETDMIINDLIIIENRLEKIILSYKRGQKTPVLQQEEAVLLQLKEALDKNQPLRTLSLSEQDLKVIRGFQFISLKPLLLIINSNEENYLKNEELITKLTEKYKVIEFAGKFEMELAKLSIEEAQMFLDDMNIKQSAIDRLTQAAYQLLGNVSFFTVGPDEVRAWTITKGDTALIAAGKIHSDLARGFIRAETFSYDDIVQYGHEKAIKDHGHLRLEGKTYIVHDGDILNIRFNV